jgi:hypothetical protein
MAALEDLATYLLGDQTQQAIAAENPYYRLQKAPAQVSQVLNAAALRDPSMSPSDALKWSVGLGLAQGLLGGAGDEYQGILTDRYDSAVTGRGTGKDLSPNLFNSAKRAGTLWNVQSGLEGRNIERQGQEKLKQDFFQALAKAETPQDRDRILRAGKAMGIEASSAFDAAPSGVAQAPVQTTVEDTTDYGPKLPLKSVRQIELATFDENVAKGMKREQAGVSSRERADDIRKRNKALVGDSLKDERDAIANAEDIIRKGEEGILKAGQTGNPLASWYEKSVATLAPILPGDQAEAKEQAAGDKALELTQNLGAAINRLKNSGALSDFESKALFATAMSPNNTPEQNKLILRYYRNGLAVAKEHQSFMNYVMDKYDGNPEMAQQLWEIYKDSNPVLKANEKGEYTLNEKRTPWQKYDFDTAYKAYMGGGSASQAGPSQGGGVPQTKIVNGVTYAKVQGGWQRVK